ncbi:MULTISPECIES: membrane protein [Streptomycetaceae]|uniref:ABC transporter permease n=1 Tax=Streptantibioticus cattleyicolor (strain ATCC 35852 / DSM 46488 / JCM 4925 / NBRC 14057 / NRRL 8057) TaxID=1003195 RepID=F8JSC4_STREN|nr:MULTISPECIES: membrane protein [Streptomycetaceae]AEW95439.1 hypothetical protein SCATT_30680 [Streptantibioticus cattleyicolor NRRL 8057 = DSM 46488]MYS60007.1 hypothetical protein [Streptomyces sp. SID5468]CCB75781.1 conserved membrane protein of unknown function [Streptantibioticus cattleyicolor NRRL 8057 = DSM 46488]
MTAPALGTPTGAVHPAESRRTPPGAIRHVLLHLLTPLLMCVGMGLAYLGAFGDPSPHHMPVAVVGQGPAPQVLAQTLKDHAGDALDVRTVPTRADAEDLLKHRDVFGAYVMSRHAPELMVATAGSDTSATVVEKVFTPVAAAQGAPLKVTDVVPPAPHDPTGQGLFFLLVAVSIGSYASVAVVGGAGAVLPMRLRALIAAGMSLVVGVIGAVFAGPVFHLVEHGLWGVWGMAWLYSAGIVLIGTGLHTFLKRWTTLGVMVLFVMLNFTSAGGVFRPEMQNGFFRALHAFWNGSGFVEGARSLVYFDHHGLGGDVLQLVLWLIAGVLVVTVAGLTERARREAQRRAAADATAVAAAAAAAVVQAGGTPRGRSPHGRHAAGLRRDGTDPEEEMEETVGV